MLFATTYFCGTAEAPGLLYLGLSEIHRDILERLQQRILFGGSEAIAAPRGFGKDTIFLIAVLWAILYGHRRFLVYIGPKMEEAEKKLERLKHQIETNPLLMEDFPEVCAPVRALERAAQRGKTQTVDGEFTYIEWGSGALKFPAVRGSLCSGAVIAPGGIDGSLRGQVSGADRPDFLAINDLETDDAARSPLQRKTNEGKIDQGLKGMVGPGKTMAAALLCTIACPGCLSERYTDPVQKPAWNGHRYRALIQFPEKMDMWEEYWHLRREGQSEGFVDVETGEISRDPYGRVAHRYYLEHREEMEAGAVVAWEDNFVSALAPDGEPMEASALEHIMVLWCDNGNRYFFSELQNDPLDEDNMLGGLTAPVVAGRLNGYEPRDVPPDVVRITQGIDIGAHEIHCTVLGIAEGATSYVLEYARILVDAPKGDLVKKDSKARPALEQAILNALRARRQDMEATPFMQGDSPRFVDLTLVDSGWIPKVVYNFCRESGPRFRPTKGLGTLKNQKRYVKPVPGDKIKPGFNYYAKLEPDGVILWFINADHWKEFTQLRFMQDPYEEGTAIVSPGACTIWGNDSKNHRLYAAHIVAERFNIEKGGWEKVKDHNHYLDCTALAHCAGRMLKITLQANVQEVIHNPANNKRVQIVPKASGERVIRRKRERVGAW